MIYKRALSSLISSHSYSLLLLGPRQTGKSTLLRASRPDLEINFADEKVFLEFSSDPGRLRGMLSSLRPKTIFIDEVQRLPSLLNTIQAIIDEDRKKHRFLLSGSSARKLKRGQANLLPGRIVAYSLGPLHLLETGNDRPLKELLSYGCLPGIVTEPNAREKKALLASYAGTYLKEEIQAEALTKNIEGFSRFLFTAAAKNGQFLDYSKLASQSSISQKTATRFFEILEDTLIVRRLSAFTGSDLRRLIRHPKFYFFDVGVLNGLLNNFMPSLDRVGSLFETLVFNQLADLVGSAGATARFSTYRTDKGAEIDLILEMENSGFAIEVKASQNVGPADLKALRLFSSENKKIRPVVVYLGDIPLEKEGVAILPLIDLLKMVAQSLK
jgi:predicted AAA+ superfamily ATPase